MNGVAGLFYVVPKGYVIFPMFHSFAGRCNMRQKYPEFSFWKKVRILDYVIWSIQTFVIITKVFTLWNCRFLQYNLLVDMLKLLVITHVTKITHPLNMIISLVILLERIHVWISHGREISFCHNEIEVLRVKLKIIYQRYLCLYFRLVSTIRIKILITFLKK